MRPSLLAMMILITSGCAAPTTAMVACPPKGCAALDPPSPIDRMLYEHAERDLQCPRAELTIANDDSTTSTVSGCGRAARYALIAQRYYGARWILDSPIVPARSQ